MRKVRRSFAFLSSCSIGTPSCWYQVVGEFRFLKHVVVCGPHKLPAPHLDPNTVRPNLLFGGPCNPRDGAVVRLPPLQCRPALCLGDGAVVRLPPLQYRPALCLVSNSAFLLTTAYLSLHNSIQSHRGAETRDQGDFGLTMRTECPHGQVRPEAGKNDLLDLPIANASRRKMLLFFGQIRQHLFASALRNQNHGHKYLKKVSTARPSPRIPLTPSSFSPSITSRDANSSLPSLWLLPSFLPLPTPHSPCLLPS